MKGNIRVGFLATIFILITCWADGVFAQETQCRVYTDEQEKILQEAYRQGSDHDLGLTLAAIAEHESFVGPYVVRDNPEDVGYAYVKRNKRIVKVPVRGAYGVTQVTLATAMDLEGEKNVWKARGKLATRLYKDDEYAISMALKKLLKVQPKAKNWRHLVAMYNGAGEQARKYSVSVANIVKKYQKCNTEDNVLNFKYDHLHVNELDDEQLDAYMKFYGFGLYSLCRPEEYLG